MKEHQPRHVLTDSWIEGDVQEVLAAEPYEAEDELYGRGQRFFFGPALEARAAFYPEHKTVEYEDPNLYLVAK